MAPQKPSATNSPSTAPPRSRDRLITNMLGVSAVMSLLTLGVVGARFAMNKPADASEILRLAASKHVEGQPIVAGKLAEKVDLGDVDAIPAESDDPNDPGLSEESQDDEPDSPAAIERKRVRDARVLQDFLVGAGKIAVANRGGEAAVVRSARTAAVARLSASREGGFPPGRDASGNAMLGETLIQLGRYDEAVEPLAASMNVDPTLDRRLLIAYARALQRSEPPQTQQAADAIKRFLNQPSLARDDQVLGREIEIETAVQLGKYDDADRLIAAVIADPFASVATPTAAEIHSLETARLMAGVIEVRKLANGLNIQLKSNGETVKLNSVAIPSAENINQRLAKNETLRSFAENALADLSEVVRTAAASVALPARLWLARLMRLLGDEDQAIAHLTEARLQRPLQSIGIVAGIEEIEALAAAGRGDEVLQTIRFLVDAIDGPTGFDATEISIDQFRRRLAAAIAVLANAGQFESAVAAAVASPTLLSRGDALFAQGEAYRAWAEATETVGPQMSLDRETAALARSRFRGAGAAYADAASQWFDTPRFIETQWLAIDCYQRGRHFTQSIELLQPYLRYQDRRRQNPALLAMARALMAEGQPERAITYLESSIDEQSRDPLRYDAQLWIAKALAELDRPDEAQTYLLKNIRDDQLTPQSPAWRDSLFTLGQLLHQQVRLPAQAESPSDDADTTTAPDDAFRQRLQTLATAQRYLDQAVARYWPSVEAMTALYSSADVDSIAAEQDAAEALRDNILEAARRGLRARSENAMNQADSKLLRLSNHLISLEGSRRLSDVEANLLRGSLLNRGDLLRKRGKWNEAADAYQIVEQRYSSTPTALEAIMRRSETLRQMGRRDEADLLIRQAKAMLEQIKPSLESQFTRVSRYDRRGWQDYLDWLCNRLPEHLSEQSPDQSLGQSS